MSANRVTNKIYVGAPVYQDSERNFLAPTVEWLDEKRIPFVILANLHLGGWQIDCVVATAHSVSVVEVKSSYLPVRGGVNGTWARFHASGDWRPYTNAYQQALAAKNTLRDEMMAAKPVGTFYPDGHVVFTSGIAEGSEVTAGDFKVTVTALDRFLSSLKLHGTAPWSLGDWQVFAAKLALTPISVDDLVASCEHRKAVDLLTEYNTAFAAEFGRDAIRWLPEDSEQRNSLLAAATTGAGCFVAGASGCGKTLMAKWVAVELANAGNPTFFFAAKDFTGSWADAIRREVALLSDQSPSALLRAISRIGRPVFLVLDGINELGTRRLDALRGVRALARRLGAKLIVTGQEEKPSELDGLRAVTVNRPSIDLKCRIAQSGGTVLSATAIEVLKAVGSGIEAEIVGKIGGGLDPGATRLVLLDQYMRMRLGIHARSGSFGLRQLASLLHEQVAFSMSEANFDEFMRVQEVRFEDCDAMFNAGLLVKRAGRVSFSHEMIQNGCAAFDLARKAMTDPVAFGSRLSMPILEEIAGDVISAIEDSSTCNAVLAEVTSPALLSAAADGDLGAIAASIARALLDSTAETCATEIRGAGLVLVKENDAVRVDWAKDSQRNWTAAERARLCAIGRRAASGAGLDSYLRLCAVMDERLVSERRRLAEAAREARCPLRSQSFALAYYGFWNQIGFTQVARASQPGLRELRRGGEKRGFSLAEMSSGQLLFYLENRRSFFGNDDEGRFAEELIYLLRERFRREPYHVQLAVLHAVGFAREAPGETLERLVEAIAALDVRPTNLGINSGIIDALKILGAIGDKDDEMRHQIKRELASALGDNEGAVDKGLALALCVKMFDHPFDSIYAEEIFELDEALRRRLYRRALGASAIKNCMSLGWLSRQVASFGDVMDAPLFQPLAALPDPSNFIPQEEWSGFVLAIRFLARHSADLPPIKGETAADLCLAEIRTLIYAAESQRPPDMEDARLAWRKLHAMPVQLVVGCLSEVQAPLIERHWGEIEQDYQPLDLVEVYPADCLKVARRFVEDGMDAQYHHRVPIREIGPSFAFSTIGRHGDRSDIDRPRGLSRAHPFSRYALVALKSLDAVTTRESF